MKSTQYLVLCLILNFAAGCDRKKTEKTVFTQPDSGRTITLVSETECEIDNGGNILLAEYSRQDNKLRVVMRAGGTASVSYFDLQSDGLRADGQIFLLPEALAKFKVTKQIRTFTLHQDAGVKKLIVTDASLETTGYKLFFANLNSIRAWDDETVIINNKDRYHCISKDQRDEVISEVKAAYRIWVDRFPDAPKERPF